MAEPKRSTLAMAIVLLLDAQPLHPYGLRQRIQEWDKDRVVNVAQRNAIYQTMTRLERDGLIEVVETERAEKRPERTVYRATREGVRIAKSWLKELITDLSPEYPRFPAALSFLPALPHKTALRALEQRADMLAGQLDDMDAQLAKEAADVDRVYLIEVEYIRAQWQAELNWLRDILDYLRARWLS